MSTPRNNLDELRRQRGNGSRAQTPEPSTSSARVTKFKPSKSLQTPENVTIRKQPGSLPAFRTSGFRKDVQASLKKHPSSAPADPSLPVEVPSDNDAPPRRARLPVKRMSSDSAYDPESSSPSKRPKLDTRTEKENQSLSTSGKGKARAITAVALEPPPMRDPPLSPRRRIVNGADRLQSPVFASASKPLPPLDLGAQEWPDLDLKPADALERMLNSNFELSNTLNDKIMGCYSGDDPDCDLTCLLEIQKLLTRRNKAIMTAKSKANTESRESETRTSASNAHVRSLSTMADSSISISAAHSVSRSEVETFTVVKKILPHAGSSIKDVSMGIPNSDDIWDSVEELPRDVDVNVEDEVIVLPPAEPVPSSFDSAIASSSIAESSAAALSRHIAQVAKTHAAANGVPTDLTKTPFYPEVKRKLRDIFGLSSFRPNQLEAISATLGGEDAVVLMPTGGGKSLCYQLPAVCDQGTTRGVTVVICPLLALMINQVEALREKAIDVAYFNSDQAAEESSQVTRRLRERGNRPRIFYITPEKLKHSGLVTRILNEIAEDGELARFVIDEGHLVIKWGRDFRDAYRYLECLRTNFPGIPIMALTATATQQVKEDLIRILKIRGCKVFWQSMNRPNLNYEVRPKKTVEKEIVHFINTYHANETGIIYARSRKGCEGLAKKLRENHGLRARHFHAGMQPADKQDALEQWQHGRCKIIVATIAFGMGIDKPDVRYVIHHDLPNDLDGYYQETGRAGRDGKPADCIMYYSWNDVNQRRRQIRDNTESDFSEKEHQEQEILRVAAFCQNNVDCRRTQVLAYYNETFDSELCNRGCDNCRDNSGIEAEDVTDMAVKIIRLAEALVDGGKHSVTRNQLLDALWGKAGSSARGTSFHSHELFGCGKDFPRDRSERVTDKLEHMGVFRSVSKQNGEWSAAYLEVTPEARKFVDKGERLIMKFRGASAKGAARTASGTAKRRKHVSAVGTDAETASVAGPSRKGPRRRAALQEEVMDLYQDDDVYDFGSPKKPATRAQGRAAAAVDADDEIEDADGDSELPYKLMNTLKDVRARIAEERNIVDPIHIITDDDLFMIAATQPSDRQGLEAVLAGADVAKTFWTHAPDFLACCRKSSGLPARSKHTNAMSISSLHQQFDYQGGSRHARS